MEGSGSLVLPGGLVKGWVTWERQTSQEVENLRELTPFAKERTIKKLSRNKIIYNFVDQQTLIILRDSQVSESCLLRDYFSSPLCLRDLIQKLHLFCFGFCFLIVFFLSNDL